MPLKRNYKKDFAKRDKLLREQLKFLKDHSRNKNKYKVSIKKYSGFFEKTLKYVIKDPGLIKRFSDPKVHQEKKIKEVTNYLLKKHKGNKESVLKQLANIKAGLRKKDRSYKQLVNRFISKKYKNKTREQKKEITNSLLHDFNNYTALLGTYIYFIRLEVLKRKNSKHSPK